MNLHARRIVIGSAATVLLISGFAAVSQAQSSSPSPRPPQGEGPQGDRPHGGHGRFGGFGGFGRFGGDLGLARGLVHGTGVVKDKDGKYVTESVQRGKASAISATSLTVTSDDGFQQTYVLTSSTKGTATDIKDAATVTVIAKQTGSAWTAQAVLTPGDRSKGFGPGGHRPGRPKPTSSVSPSADA